MKYELTTKPQHKLYKYTSRKKYQYIETAFRERTFGAISALQSFRELHSANSDSVDVTVCIYDDIICAN